VTSISVAAIFICVAGGIACWLLVRFPSLGPRGLRSALVVAFLTVALEQPLLALLNGGRASSGRAAALVLVSLPLLTMLFWSSGCLVRATATARRR
jgi:hypothetical protein